MDSTIQAGDQAVYDACPLRIREIGGKAVDVSPYSYMAHGSEVYRFGTHINTLANLRCAIVERMFFVRGNAGLVKPPKPKKGFFNKVMKKIRGRLRNFAVQLEPFSRERFLEDYVGRKRANYNRAFDDLEINPLNKRDSSLRCFVKNEKHNMDAKKRIIPRVVSPRGIRYNCKLGKFTKAVEKPIYRVIQRIFGSTTPVVFKGLNTIDRGLALQEKWKEFDAPVAVGLDASRFDQHCSTTALKWEHSVYQDWFKNYPELKDLLECQLENRINARCLDGFISGKVRGCRMSGDMNTALGNCLLMSCMIYSFMNWIHVDKFQLANDGDDCLLIVEKSDLDRVESKVKGWFLKMGYTMKMEEAVGVFEELEFCQCHPVMVDGSPIMVRDPCVALSKDTISLKVKNRERWIDVKHAVGLCGLSLCAGIPMMQEFYLFLLRGEQPSGAVNREFNTGMERLSRGLEPMVRKVTPETRESFNKAFGLDPIVQVMVEEHYRTLVPIWGKPENTVGNPPDITTVLLRSIKGLV